MKYEDRQLLERAIGGAHAAFDVVAEAGFRNRVVQDWVQHATRLLEDAWKVIPRPIYPPQEKESREYGHIEKLMSGLESKK